MPTLEQDKMIKDYFSEVKDKYPNLSFERFAEVCKTPFNFIKKIIRDDNLPVIMIKYLGKIRPFQSRIKQMIGFFTKKTDEHYVAKTEFLTEYLKALNEYDKKDQEVD